MNEIAENLEKSGERFLEYLKYKGVARHKAEVDMGLSNGTLKKAAEPGRKLSPNSLEQIEKYCTDLNMEWLRSGKGSMLIDSVNQSGNNSNIQNSTINSPYSNSPSFIEKVLNEIAAQRRLAEVSIAKSQEQIDRLITIIENMQK